MAILEERGKFWWLGETVPEGNIAPEKSESGILRIEDDGHAWLELDGHLDSTPVNTWTMMFSGNANTLNGKSICGILRESEQRVILRDLYFGGGRLSSNGLSYESYHAMYCLVGICDLPGAEELYFSKLIIDLDGFEGWLGLGSIRLTGNENAFIVEYREPSEYTCDIADGIISINYKISKPFHDFTHSYIDLKQSAYLGFDPKQKMRFNEIRKYFSLFEDLFILLTNSEKQMKFPVVILEDDEPKSQFQCYFARISGSDEAPKRHDCVANFQALRGCFGHIVQNFSDERERVGPGFYLYLGSRRGMDFYPENRFINLILGFESFHRKTFPGRPDSKLQTKISRILDNVSNKNDRNWLMGRLKHADEPSLSSRVFDVINLLPIDLDSKLVRKFSLSCAEMRNEISHFGSKKKEHEYNDFILEIERKSAALSLLSHILILSQIGIDSEIIKYWIDGHPRAGQNQSRLVEAGLLHRPKRRKGASGEF